MSTQAQQSANAVNSRLSTGPTTATGKQKASRNSAKHYFTAKQIVVPGEIPEDYSGIASRRADRAKRLAAHARPPPGNRHVHQDDAQPRADGLPNHKVAMLRAFLDNTKEFDNLRRYATPIERAYHNAIAELTKLQKQREIHEIGSVSQTPEPKPFTRGPLPAQAIQLTRARPVT